MVAGLTLFGASAVFPLPHASVVHRTNADDALQASVSKAATHVLGIFTVMLGIVFQTQNVAYIVSHVSARCLESNVSVMARSLRASQGRGSFEISYARLYAPQLGSAG